MSRILRYEVPVNDKWHELSVSPSLPLHVACRDLDVVEFWAWEVPEPVRLLTEFRVVGTGQPFDDEACRHVGTAIAPGGALVWHLMRRT